VGPDTATSNTRSRGLNRFPDYVHPTLSDLPGAEEYFKGLSTKGEILVGACHCKAVKFAVKTEPLEQVEEINDCACSICLGVSCRLDRASFTLLMASSRSVTLLNFPSFELPNLFESPGLSLSMAPLTDCFREHQLITERRAVAVPEPPRCLFHPVYLGQIIHGGSIFSDEVHLRPRRERTLFLQSVRVPGSRSASCESASMARSIRQTTDDSPTTQIARSASTLRC